MKSIEEYMSLPYKMEIEPDSDEGGFVVSFPELPGCISSGGDILYGLILNIKMFL